MFAASVPVALQALDQALVLSAAATPRMLQARLHADMFNCAEQLETVASFALRATYPLTARAMPELRQAPLAEMLQQTKTAVAALTPADFADAEARRVQHVAGFADLDQSAQDYLQHFALPNLWFHLSMAYAILRQEGADIGKADFDGLHSYPKDFSFNPE